MNPVTLSDFTADTQERETRPCVRDEKYCLGKT